MEAAFRGALYLLQLERNWEQHGTETPENAAQMWLEANLETFGMSKCGEQIVHVGTIFWFPSETPPTGAVVCDGSLLDTTEYGDLFDIVGYSWGGSGDDFAVPDLRGNFIRAGSDSLDVGDTGGEEDHTLTVAELPEHSHTLDAVSPTFNYAPGSMPFYQYAPGYPFMSTNATGGDTAHNNVPPYTVLCAMIQAL